MKAANVEIFILGILASVFQVSNCQVNSDQWETFKLQYGKKYESKVEESLRMRIFAENMVLISSHNEMHNAGMTSFKLAMNEFGDLLPSEFSSTRKGLKGFSHKKNMLKSSTRAATFIEPDNDIIIPESFDWRQKGAVTEVKDQGDCGSCWAFSVTGVLEGQEFLKTGKLVSLSEQNLVDCSINVGNEGCSGGLMELGYLYIQQNKGIDTEESYPYQAVNDVCRFDKSHVGADDSGYVNVTTTGDELALKKAVATIGPISVAIDASSARFQFYSSGVYEVSNCKTANNELDHGVLAVGYGTDNGTDYWLVKNSWGANWGIKGYIKMRRNFGNMCGIATDATYPLICD